jgi:nucleoside-diphosphate-sugar epimerase
VKVLITGACGWIGRHLVRGLVDRGHKVASYDLKSCGGVPAMQYIGDVRGRRLGRDVGSVLRAWKPDAVVHLAARYGRVWCENDKADTFDVNVTGTAVVAQACQEQDFPLTLASSSEVYGVRVHSPGVPWSWRYAAELHALRPLNTYGESKLMAEQVAHRIIAPDLLSIWRLNMPYGPGGRPGDSGVPGVGYNALHTWMWQAVHGLNLIVHRKTSRSWTFIDDVVAAMVMLLETGHRGTINVCSSRDMRSSRDTAELVLEQAPGSTSTVLEVDAPPEVTPSKRLDDSALLELGWRPTVSLPEGIVRTIGYMRRFDVGGGWIGETAAAAPAR